MKKLTAMAILAIILLGSYTSAFAEMSTKEKLQALYITYWDRAADPGGLTYWVSTYNGGAKYVDISNAFGSYIEFPDTDQKRTDFITGIYRNLFNRAPDPGGLIYWAETLKRGGITPGGLVIAIINAGYDQRNAEPGLGLDSWLNMYAKIQIAEYFTDALVAHGVDCELQGLHDAVAGINKDSDLVTTKLVIDGLFESKSPPEMSISNGFAVINFNTSIVFTTGVFGDVNPDNVELVQWNSWNENSYVTYAPLSKDANNRWQAVLTGMQSGDTGNFSLRMKDGSQVTFTLSEWKITGTVFTIRPDGSMEYGAIGIPTLSFSQSKLVVNFGGSILKGLSIAGIPPAAVEHVQWNSDLVGWENNSSVHAILQRDSGGNLSATLTGMPNGDSGFLAVKLKNGTYAWLASKSWRYLGLNASFDPATDRITYGSLGVPTLTFTNSTLSIKFGSNVLTGLSAKGVNPADVVKVQWNSDRVGWNYESTVRAALQTGSDGNLTATLSGMPNGDSGLLSIEKIDGTFVWFVSEVWKCDGMNSGYDVVKGRINYGSYDILSLNFSGSTLRVNFGSNVLSGLSTKGINPADVAWVQWNSDLMGWVGESTIHATLQTDTNGNLFATLSGMPNGDVGLLSIKLKNGNYVWFVNSLWKYLGSNSVYDLNTSRITYGTFSKPSLVFANSSLTVNFGNSVLSGLSVKGINPADVAWVQWNSDTVGWENNSIVHSVLQTDANGNLYAKLTGMSNSDNGFLAIKLKDGSFVWFVSGAWKYSTNATYNSITGRIQFTM